MAINNFLLPGFAAIAALGGATSMTAGCLVNVAADLAPAGGDPPSVFPLDTHDALLAFGTVEGCFTDDGELRCWTSAGLTGVLATDVAALEGDAPAAGGEEVEPFFLTVDGRMFSGAEEPVLVDDGPFIDVTAAGCALRENGTVFCASGAEHEGTYRDIDAKGAAFCGVLASDGSLVGDGAQSNVGAGDGTGPFSRVFCSQRGDLAALREDGTFFDGRFPGSLFLELDLHYQGGVTTVCGVTTENEVDCRSDINDRSTALSADFVDVDIGDPRFICGLTVDGRVLCTSNSEAPAPPF